MSEPEQERSARAEKRRATWSGEVVAGGTPKPDLHADASIVERLGAMTRLCRQLWLISGKSIARQPRSDWPGEVFEIRREHP